jgi:hypothetical protein
VLALTLAAVALLAPTVPPGNLLQNAGAEAGQASQSGETAVEIPGWQTTSRFTVVPYGGGGAPDFFTFPPPSESQRIHGGKNFFAGGFQVGKSTASQTVDVARAAPLVDAGRVSVTLSAWLGGFLDQPDPGIVAAIFVDVNGNAIASTSIGPVTPAERDNDLEFVQKTGRESVPPGTRKIRVMMTAVQEVGTYADAYFDNVVLTLNGPSLRLSRRCARNRITVTASVPAGLTGRSVTFRLGSKAHTDRKPPFTATFATGRKPVVLLASGGVSVAGRQAVIPGRLIVHCP